MVREKLPRRASFRDSIEKERNHLAFNRLDAHCYCTVLIAVTGFFVIADLVVAGVYSKGRVSGQQKEITKSEPVSNVWVEDITVSSPPLNKCSMRRPLEVEDVLLSEQFRPHSHVPSNYSAWRNTACELILGITKRGRSYPDVLFPFWAKVDRSDKSICRYSHIQSRGPACFDELYSGFQELAPERHLFSWLGLMPEFQFCFRGTEPSTFLQLSKSRTIGAAPFSIIQTVLGEIISSASLASVENEANESQKLHKEFGASKTSLKSIPKIIEITFGLFGALIFLALGLIHIHSVRKQKSADRNYKGSVQVCDCPPLADRCCNC